MPLETTLTQKIIISTEKEQVIRTKGSLYELVLYTITEYSNFDHGVFFLELQQL